MACGCGKRRAAARAAKPRGDAPARLASGPEPSELRREDPEGRRPRKRRQFFVVPPRGVPEPERGPYPSLHEAAHVAKAAGWRVEARRI